MINPGMAGTIKAGKPSACAVAPTTYVKVSRQLGQSRAAYLFLVLMMQTTRAEKATMSVNASYTVTSITSLPGGNRTAKVSPAPL